MHLRPLAEFPRSRACGDAAVLTDIDDTLTDHGRLPAASYMAMERLQQAGLIVIPVTGRPAGWCDLIARQWPVDGVVGENGAFYFRHLDAERRMLRALCQGRRHPSGRARLKLDRHRERCWRRCRAAAVASDQAYREADLAIDFCEDVAPLPHEAIDADRRDLRRAMGRRPRSAPSMSTAGIGGYDKLDHDPVVLRRGLRNRHGAIASAESSLPAIRPMMRRCSAISPIRSAWPTSLILSRGPPPQTEICDQSPRRPWLCRACGGAALGALKNLTAGIWRSRKN